VKSREDSFYLPELDGLRFFAFLAVFLYHSAAPLPAMPPDAGHSLALCRAFLRSGCYGVDLFFTLSAYLITELLMRERARTGTINFAAFYIRRMLRIWPLYFGFLGLLAITSSLPAVFYVSSVLFVGNFFSGTLIGHGAWAASAAVLWSISVEEQFYLAWPLILRYCERDRLLRTGIVLWACALLGREVISASGVIGLPLWWNTFAHLDSIAAGVVLAAVGVERSHFHRYCGPLLVGGICLWIISALNVPFEFGAGLRMMAAFALIAPGSMAIVAGALGSARLLRSRPIVYLGQISYGLYIFHSSAIRACANAFGEPTWAISPMALAITIILAASSYRFFEAPFLRLKARFQSVPSGDSHNRVLENRIIAGDPADADQPGKRSSVMEPK
jgi:peptidoglycan/LPS O-acetylase OafA/YrhL